MNKIEVIQFDRSVADEVGVHKAILLYNIAYWCAVNQKKEENLIDGDFWMWKDATGFRTSIPDVSIFTVRRFLNELEESGWIKSFVPDGRIKWYRPSATLYSFISNTTMKFLDRTVGKKLSDSLQKAQSQSAKSSVTVCKLQNYNKEDTKENNKESIKGELSELKIEFNKLWIDYGRIGTKATALKNYFKLNTDERKEVLASIPECLKGTTHTDGAQSRIGKFKPFRQHLSTYLNKANRHWERFIDEKDMLNPCTLVSLQQELKDLEAEMSYRKGFLNNYFVTPHYKEGVIKHKELKDKIAKYDN